MMARHALAPKPPPPPTTPETYLADPPLKPFERRPKPARWMEAPDVSAAVGVRPPRATFVTSEHATSKHVKLDPADPGAKPPLAERDYSKYPPGAGVAFGARVESAVRRRRRLWSGVARRQRRGDGAAAERAAEDREVGRLRRGRAGDRVQGGRGADSDEDAADLGADESPRGLREARHASAHPEGVHRVPTNAGAPRGAHRGPHAARLPLRRRVSGRPVRAPGPADVRTYERRLQGPVTALCRHHSFETVEESRSPRFQLVRSSRPPSRGRTASRTPEARRLARTPSRDRLPPRSVRYVHLATPAKRFVEPWLIRRLAEEAASGATTSVL